MSSLDGYYLDELVDDQVVIDDDGLGLGEVLGEALLDQYADAAPDELDAALLNALETLTPAEAINFTSALRQVEKGTARTLQHPAVAQLAKTGLPLAGGAVGTLVGGPVGTAVGSGLGGAAAKALSGRPAATAPPPATGLQGSSVASGSTAAARGLVLTQQPEVLKSLLCLALGQHGCRSVAGMPVGAVMNMLSKTFEQAAADADELLEIRDGLTAYRLDADGELYADPASPDDRAQALYSDLLDAENEYLTEAAGER
ncbi:MAG TPA: hypothetical protein VGV57_06515 [Thermoleophilaceae bacterium]|nr:hypothetical protein [Thermoleophilaceae bacterium]